MEKTIKICAITILCTSIFWTGLFCTYGKANEETTEQISVVETTTEATTEATTVYIAPVTTEELTTVKYEDIPKLRELGRFKITGYTPTCTHCCGKSDCIGASGKKVIVGETVAMNRADMRNYGLEYGDKIYIEGIGERVIVDTGCEQGKVDVACDSHESCFAITGYYRVHYVIE
jgi:3D (Asp-Asp-Asp) domain-containing protein